MLKQTVRTMASVLKFIDIGANLTDPMYQGIYHDSSKHAPDLPDVLERGWQAGVSKIIITGGNLEDSIKALDLAKSDERLFSTVGCHPTRSLDFEKSGDPEIYLNQLEDLCKNNPDKIVAFGEFGLDYDRLHFAPKEAQQRYFERQLQLNEKLRLPMFLHCRAASADFLDVLDRYQSLTADCKGVVHSFDGTMEEMKAVIQRGLSIGINGCSLKTDENLDVLKNIPKDRLLMETDCPWCEVRPRHAGYKYVQTEFPNVKKEKWAKGMMVKSRNEPANIVQVMEIVAAVRGEDKEDLARQIYDNTLKLFFSK